MNGQDIKAGDAIVLSSGDGEIKATVIRVLAHQLQILDANLRPGLVNTESVRRIPRHFPTAEAAPVSPPPPNAATKRMRPDADLMVCFKMKVPMDGGRGHRFMETAVKLAAFDLLMRYPDDMRAIWTSEQIAALEAEMMAWAGHPQEEVYHLALFGHTGARALKQEHPKAREN